MGILIKNIICFNEEGAEGPLNGPKGYWGPKWLLGAQRAPQPLAGARRKGAQHPELLVIL